MSKSSDTNEEHPLTAVVLCDNWGVEARWGPLIQNETSDTDDSDSEDNTSSVNEQGERGALPWALLPLVNIPLLAWTLESLASSSVKRVIIFSRVNTPAIREWVEKSVYSDLFAQVILRPTSATTPGDILRELDGLQMVPKSDFLLVQAGYLGNIDVRTLVEEFSAMRSSDADLVMSCVLARRSFSAAGSYKEAVVVTTPQLGLVHYEEGVKFPATRKVTLSRRLFDDNATLTVRTDLESVGIVICSPEVPPLLSENFDYQYLYPDFVNGILTSDLLGKRFCCSIVGEPTRASKEVDKVKSDGKKDNKRESNKQKKEREEAAALAAAAAMARSGRRFQPFAGVVENTKSYDFVSRAILARKTYPFVPDECLPIVDGRIQKYTLKEGNVYCGRGAAVSRKASAGPCALIGAESRVGDHSSVAHSVIGENVTIGEHCTLSGAYIFDGAVLGDHVTVRDSIVGRAAVVGSGARITGGSLIGPTATIAGEIAGSVVLADRAGATPLDQLEGADDSDSDADPLDTRNFGYTSMGGRTRWAFDADAALAESDSGTESDTDSDGGSASGSDTDDDSDGSVDSEFVQECTLSLDRCFAEGHSVDNAAIELKTLKMASNVSTAQVLDVVVPYLLRKCKDEASVGGLVARWGGLISGVTLGQEDGMAHAILSAQNHLAATSASSRFFLVVLREFYQHDVIDEDAAIAWVTDPESRKGERMLALWEGAKPFIEFLNESDDDESEEDEESD